MPQYIMKIHDDKCDKDYYLIWSTIVDAPVTYGMSLEEFKQYYQAEFGKSGMERLKERMERVRKTGISAHPPFANYERYFESNRAGDKETRLDKEGILEKYCRNSV
jgi:hypothetical protein